MLVEGAAIDPGNLGDLCHGDLIHVTLAGQFHQGFAQRLMGAGDAWIHTAHCATVSRVTNSCRLINTRGPMRRFHLVSKGLPVARLLYRIGQWSARRAGRVIAAWFVLLAVAIGSFLAFGGTLQD